MNRFCTVICRWLLPVVFLTAEVAAQVGLDFGPVRIQSAQVDTLRIANPGLVEMLVDRITLTDEAFSLAQDPFSGDFVYVAPGQTQSLLVAFAPVAVREYSARIVLGSGVGFLEFEIKGEGAEEVVVINEILADPPNGLAGDANRDGVRDTYADEFVELLNIGRYPIYLGGLHLSDANAAPPARFAFPSGTWIGPGEYVVLFGGGNPTGFSGQVFADNGRIGGGLANSGDAVFLIDPAGPDTLARAVYGPEGGRDLSLVRHPEGRGPWVLHNSFPGRGDAFSPGQARVVLSSLELSPAHTVMDIGDTLVLGVTAAFSDQSPADLGGEITYLISDSARLVPVGNHRFLGLVPGLVEILAVAGGVASNPAVVEIRPPDLVGIEVAPGDMPILVGDTLSVVVQGLLADSARVALLEGVTWRLPPSVKMAGGRLIGQAPGTTEVVAVYEGFEAPFSLQVLAYGDLNGDGIIDLVDAVRAVHLILGIPPPPVAWELRSADLDGNGEIDIRDLVRIIGLVLGIPAEKPLAVAPEGSWWMEGNDLVLESAFPVQAVFLKWVGGPMELQGQGGGLWMLVETVDGIQTGVVTDLGGTGFQSLRLRADGGEIEVKTMEAVSRSGQTVSLRLREGSPGVRLGPGFPNPFNPTTILPVYLPEAQYVMLVIYSVKGQEVVRLLQGEMPAGNHQVSWDGRDHQGRPAGSGVYLAVLKTNHGKTANKLVLLR